METELKIIWHLTQCISVAATGRKIIMSSARKIRNFKVVCGGERSLGTTALNVLRCFLNVLNRVFLSHLNSTALERSFNPKPLGLPGLWQVGGVCIFRWVRGP